MKGNFISASTFPLSDSNANNTPPGRNNENNVKHLPSFICYPNGIVLRVPKQNWSRIQSKSSLSSKRSDTSSERSMEMNQLRVKKKYFNEFLNKLLAEKQCSTK
mmetsp:Transcript_39264/g.44864  ORF Transcript_39264/g.44864 Transcript_39264/m.44864 type:complete len:104 (+) Transcript_39264:68-379(+)